MHHPNQTSKRLIMVTRVRTCAERVEAAYYTQDAAATASVANAVRDLEIHREFTYIPVIHRAFLAEQPAFERPEKTITGDTSSLINARRLKRHLRVAAAIIVVLGIGGCASTPGGHPQHATGHSHGSDQSGEDISLLDAGPQDPPGAASQAAGKTAAPRIAALEDEETFDLWTRIRGLFSLSEPLNERTRKELASYLAKATYLDRVQARARPYLYFITEEVERRGLPGELVLLPVVESAFQPYAYSPGRAAGLWQFIPSTGRMFGLKQNWWYDGRRDVLASTDAALSYLEQLSTEFDGDWLLALAAYNSGAGTVRRAVAANRDRGLPVDFWSLNLPRETSAYVPRLLAVAQIIAHPELYQLQLQPIPDEPYFAVVETETQIDLHLAAGMADLSPDELYVLNPGFNRWATDPDGPHRLLVPLDRAEPLRDGLEQTPPEARITWHRYRIRPGDSLLKIAKQHQTTVAVLQQANKLNGTAIRAGKHLMIPIASQPSNTYAREGRGQAAEPIESGPQADAPKSSYTVKTGDSLWEIARTYGVNTRELARWNAITPEDVLRPGQRLTIWTGEPVAQRDSEDNLTSVPNVDAAKPSDTRRSLSYAVREGDSLFAIAQRFRVSVADLRKWNRIANDHLYPGQKLRLYVDVTELVL